jgi:hypothetical protein
MYTTRFLPVFALCAVASLTSVGCGSAKSTGDAEQASSATESNALSATIGAAGGELTGAKGTAFEGVHIVIPAGALSSDTAITVTAAPDEPALPPAAKACGPTFSIAPAGLTLAQPATVTLPFDESVVEGALRNDDEVKVWVMKNGAWGQEKQIDGAAGSVTIELSALTDVAAGVNPPKPKDVVRFKLVPNPKLVKCLAQYPDDPKRQPTADVLVVRGDLNDTLTMRAQYIKPGLKFDMFTVQNGSLGADGKPAAGFLNFGLAWYQSDVDARDDGDMHVQLRTVLLDQIFGFDPAAPLAPTGTFELGIWFNDPNDAAACGFNVAAPTPFNGDHKAGPLAMISLPDAKTNLGPLCTAPDTSVTPARCSP